MLCNIGRIAVLICGEYREWSRTAKYIFDMAEAYSNDVDYYFATWNVSKNLLTSTSQIIVDADVTSAFENRKLISYKIVDIETVKKFNTTFLYQAHLAKIANILKRRHEIDNDFVYDQVIEIRPDFYVPKLKTEVRGCYDFEFVGASDIYYINNTPLITDTCFRTNSFGNDVIANRIKHHKVLDSKPIISSRYDLFLRNNHHWILLDYLTSKRMYLQQDYPYDLGFSSVVRPNWPDVDFNSLSFSEIQQLDNEWKSVIQKK